MKYFCTLSDINYLAKGLALYKSLKATSSEPFQLHYLCVDEQSVRKLKELNLESLIPISLNQLEQESEELRTAKSNRPYNEYCWTLASWFCWHLIQSEITHITYIDSDIYFYDDIEKFYAEVGSTSVGIIAHRHNSVGHRDGAYNVGIIYFKNDAIGKKCLFWWMDAVLNKRFPHLATCGDQKYLEEFIPLFGSDNVTVVDKTIGHGAPWNYRLYKWDKFNKDRTIGWGDKTQPFVFNHFSRFSYNIDNDSINFTSGNYSDHTLNGSVFRIPEVFNLYQNYYLELKKIHQEMLSPKPTSPAIIDSPLRISFGMIVLNGDSVLKQCIEAVYPFAYQILIAEGPVSYWQTKGIFTSTDKTNDILAHFPDPQNKIKVIHGQYSEKDDQCRAYMVMRNQNTDYMWNLDSDEVYKAEDIEKTIQLLHDHQYTSVGIQSTTFYGGFDRYLTGFELKKDNFLRVFRVYPGSTWKTHRPPTMLHTINVTPKHLDSERLFGQTGVTIYHYSYVFPKQVHFKISYYKESLSKEKCIDDYFNKVYLPWILGNDKQRTVIENQFQGVHEWKPEYRGPCFTAPFTGSHPMPIARDMPLLMNEFISQKEQFAIKKP